MSALDCGLRSTPPWESAFSQLFIGAFGSCSSNSSIDDKAHCVPPLLSDHLTNGTAVAASHALGGVINNGTTAGVGGNAGRPWSVPMWLNPPLGSFDDFGSAMLLLFVASTGDGWEELMFLGMDAVSLQPSERWSLACWESWPLDCSLQLRVAWRCSKRPTCLSSQPADLEDRPRCLRYLQPANGLPKCVWPQIGPDRAQVRNDFSPAALYFISWLLLGTLTLINLFVGSASRLWLEPGLAVRC